MSEENQSISIMCLTVIAIALTIASSLTYLGHLKYNRDLEFSRQGYEQRWDSQANMTLWVKPD